MNNPNVIFEMSNINCTICSHSQWLLLKSEEELLNYRCPICNSTFVDIYSYEFNEQQIEYLSRQNI